MKIADLAVAGVKTERLKWLHGAAASRTGSHVLYWMQTSLRTRFNYSLHVAVTAANTLRLPLYVLFTFDTREALMSERHMAFLLESLVDTKKALGNIPIEAIHCAAGSKGPLDLVLGAAAGASLVVTDHPYIRAGRKQTELFAEQANVPVLQVEGDVVVPVTVVSTKEEYAARTIRPKITKHLPQYLIPLSPNTYDAHDDQMPLREFKAMDLTPNDHWIDLGSSVDALLADADDVDRSIPRVSTFLGGETQAQAVLATFLSDKLLKYDKERNEPSGNGASNMSPFLHYGTISPVDIALQVQAKEGRGPAMAASKASFLEELIVRRELSMNFVWFNPNHYDTIKSLPPFATETLAIHAEDKRAYVYSEEELDKAMTHDAFWNAAQLDMISNGKMQNYMRMYWGKKIIEWTSSPEEAYGICVRLNDKYNLDGFDPNSYAGIAWVFGKHDTGWTERPIFGKVRYMNADGLKRKYDMTAYVNMIKRQCAKVKMTLLPKQLAIEITKPKAKRQKKA
ncbi:deoxyribodipyrimidine photo-lyase type II [Achlya hypogyna]|uniref:Deoxyribodipyrimidine photo-lyase n=1 Tax=Achlya hypogyna TaxID=1202772 RepID=A0A1V9Z0E9_ACHHY|nr:deoxyribodipyrimidine photo-lyase type II [Achlya hypogyna]